MLSWELFGLLLLIGLIWLWIDSLKAREIGIAAARAACQAEGWQLLDETVSIAKLNLARNDDGRLQLRRAYDFEYSDTGDNRVKGGVVMLGHRVLVLNVGFPKRPPLTLVH
ncbi:hypothetical protein BURK2_00825 [Burkholderiales bacterium]|nr:MAG: DUF3301 domain-containing protein [Burkholderiales bacterium]CAG0962668.1 hypothetical protein BURK2_00825 [Burkholderiales bacterium]